MSAPTTAVRFLIARAAVRTTGVAHLVSQRDTGALNPICGANPIRSTTIEYPDTVTCDACATINADLAGTNGNLLELPLDQIHLAGTGRAADLGLIDSVRTAGVLVPVIVDRAHNLIAGARRLDAARTAGLRTVPAIVVDAEPTITRLLENLHRQGLDPIAQAHAYQDACATLGISKAELGRRLGISRPQISNTIRLLDLPADAQARIVMGELSAQEGRGLLSANRSHLKDLKLAKTAQPDLSTLLAAYLQAQVKVTTTPDRARITIDVPDADLPRLLEQLGLRTKAAA